MKGFNLIEASEDGSKRFVETLNFSTTSTDTLFSDSTPRKKPRTRLILISVVAIIGLAAIITLAVVFGIRNNKGNEGNEQGSQEFQQGNSSSSSTTSKTTQSSSTSSTTRTTTGSYPQVDWMGQPCHSSETHPQCPWKETPLILVSLDGFKAEYLLRNITPTIQRLRNCGVHTQYMRAVYPTLTFPNHYTIVTGLYPESHGIVGNSMYDPTHNGTFSIGGAGKFNSYWWQGEPLWTTAIKHGKKAASFFWVGSEVNISGCRPTYWEPYNGSITWEARIDRAMKWLELPAEDRPQFITLYFDEPDHQGHGSGPDSTEIDAMLKQVDRIIGYLMNSLLQRRLDHCVNLIVLADHGMSSTSCGRKVTLENWLPEVKNMLVYSGTTGFLHTKYHQAQQGSGILDNSHIMETEKVLQSLRCIDENVGVYSRADMPVRHHYASNERIGEVVVDVEDSWLFTGKKDNFCLAGNHGYDNIYKSMHALFLAHGPGFKQEFTAEPFENIELYNMMSVLLNITPSPNNGTFGALHHMLKDPPTLLTGQGSLPQTCNISYICSSLNTLSQLKQSSQSIFPWGLPSNDNSKASCIHHGAHVASIYSTLHNSPTMAVFRMKSGQVVNSHQTVTNSQCPILANGQLGLEASPLVDPDYMDVDAQPELQSGWNMIPMFKGFKQGIWKYAWRSLADYRKTFGDIHVTVGTIFDYDSDGIADKSHVDGTRYADESRTIPVASHMFVSVVKCSTKVAKLEDCLPVNLDIFSFVLPHRNDTYNCLPDREYLTNNVVRLRDIEHLTGLRLLETINGELNARLRTYLPLEMWTSPLTVPWDDLSCADTDMGSCPAGPHPVLLLSLDGFRADYMTRGLNPTLARLGQCGVNTPYMRPVYPTLTLPNLYSIITGLYPESHGMVNEEMYDPEIGQRFEQNNNSADPRWWRAEPIWVTAKKKGLRTAALYWPASVVNFTGGFPDYRRPWHLRSYFSKTGGPERIKEVLDLLMLPTDVRPHLLALRLEQPELAGLEAGPNSDEVNGRLASTDKLLGHLMSALYENNLHNCINIVIVSDHGLGPTSCDRSVLVQNIYHNISSTLMFDGPVAHIFPQLSKPAIPVSDLVNNLSCQVDSMHVFTKESLPVRYHYTASPRIGDVILDMKESWLAFQNKASKCSGGRHGWDNLYSDMRSVFVAHGPAFKTNFTAEPFESIELYNLLAEVIGITLNANNGTDGALRHILKNSTGINIGHSESKPYNTCEVPADPFAHIMCTSTCQIEQADAKYLHVTSHPFDIPALVQDGHNVCVLNQTGYVIGYSDTFKAPVWVQATVKNLTEVNNVSASEPSCWLNDTRIDRDMCSIKLKEGISFYTLYPFGKQNMLSSTAVPLFDEFYHGLWTFVVKLLADYSHLYGDISLTLGAIFDHDYNGLWENLSNKTNFADYNRSQPLPSHIYMSLMKPVGQTSGDVPAVRDMDILSFILPHTARIPNCLNWDAYLQKNVARLRDIELASGLQFLTSLDRDAAARLRTYLPEELWKTSLVQSWDDVTSCPNEAGCMSDYRPLLLISLDGFRADYLLRNVTPTVSRLSQCGVRAPYMRSVYPTKTFPNHYSVVTGLYPESHGIIDNNMYDVDMKLRFSLGSAAASDPRWWGGEPMWLTAKRHGLKTATYFWPGSDVEVHGNYPDIWKKYDGKVSYTARTQEVLRWLSLPPGQRPNFITLYFDEPDMAGHKYGPKNEIQIAAALKRVDDSLRMLMEGLVARKLHHCVNLVVIADHGMADISCNNIVRLKDIEGIDNDYLSSKFWVWDGAFGRIADTYANNSTARGPYPVETPAPSDELVVNLTCASPHMRVFRKSNLPVRHHYTNNRRIDNIILDMESGWQVTRSYINTCNGGNHGYDNIYKSMEALFLAYGPAFRFNQTVEPFENIELYNLFADVLNITPAPNNGTMGSLDHLLRSPPDRHTTASFVEYRTINNSALSQEQYIEHAQNISCKTACTITNVKLHAVYNAYRSVSSQDPPGGAPRLLSDYFRFRNITVSRLSTSSVAYDIDHMTPIWVFQQLASERRFSNTPGCRIPDPNIPAENSQPMPCGRQANVTAVNLLLGHNESDSLVNFVSSAFVRVPALFERNVWTQVLEFVQTSIAGHELSTELITGPAFDHNYDGLPDTNLSHSPFPSHVYVVLIRCGTGGHRCGDIQLSSYILPVEENTTMCKDFKIYMEENEARLRDVELITGLQFMSDDGSSAQIRTRLPWSRLNAGELKK
ncbi:uncharacterized protein LOC127876504 isoform X2 [Dreissena polymorpha]|uniref:ENPP1-3/EXOG-like endonuclease/phosphodiesterase domain-containing protein n=1 Tax=Dreissena polymorpha TaxID=45954 RepID=A0A9D4HG39_DREPO|nr:uncharacterized protein LOC127876504 isoform X2 [Dreissena polymorpha]KAH3831572.1 hypothetical protein DPMN_104842 [Dreissena polymorpha]